MKDEPFNQHIESARHSLKALRERLRTIPGAPGVGIAGHLDDIGTALDAAALEWSQQRDALAASQTKIAEGARAAKALRESEEMFHAIADYTADWENWIGPDGKLLWVNPAVEQVTGYSAAEFRAMHTLSMPLSTEEDRKVVRAQFQRAMAGTRENDQEFRFVHKDGTTRWASVSWQPIFARDGTPLGHRSSVRDVTRRKRAEVALRESEELFRRLSEAAFEAIAIHENGVLLNANDQYFKMFGYEPGEVLGKQVMPMTVAPEARELMTKQMAAGGRGPYESVGLRKDGTRFPVELRGRQMEYKGRNVRVGAIVDLTERKRAEEAMRVSEGQLRGFFHASPAGMAVLDTELRYLRINERLANMNGQPVEAHLGKTLREILPAFAPIIEPLCRQVLLSGKPILDHELGGETTRAAGMDGDWIISYFPVPDRNGTPAALGVVVTDISARKQVEKELRESEERYRRLFEVESDAILVMDVETGRYLDANAAAEKLYGYSRAELLALKHGDISAEPQETRQAIAAHETHIPIRWHRRKDGTVFPVEITVSYFESQGRQVHVAAIRDITERKRAEAALREREARLRALFENSMVGILLTAPGGRVFAANPAACRMFGRTEADICGLGRSGLVNRRDARVNALVREREQKGCAVGEMSLVRADGTCFPAQVSSAAFETAEGPRTCMVIQDISERKLAEARIRDFSRKLLTVREEEKRRISAVLHHDVGSFTVGVTAHLLAAGGDLRKGKYKEALAALKEGHRLFAQSVRRLKSLAVELRPPDLDILGLPAALRQHFSLLTNETSLRVRFTDATHGIAISPETQTILFRVVQESLNNVVKHAHAHQVRVRLSVPRKTIRLSIADDGKGFDPFRAAARPGTRLGLRIAHEMVAALGGEFMVDASPGRGTTVLVTLPQGGPKT